MVTKLREDWQIGDIVKMGCVKNVKVTGIAIGKNNHKIFSLESIKDTKKKYRYEFPVGIKRVFE